MTVFRWKVMAGVLGVSIGGIAALAGQNGKSDGAKTPPPPPAADAPKAAPALPGLPDLPPPGEPLNLPAVPAPAAGAPRLPDAPPVVVGAPKVGGVDLPAAGGPAPATTPIKPEMVKPEAVKPELPAAAPTQSLPQFAPSGSLPPPPAADLGKPELPPAGAAVNIAPPPAAGTLPPAPMAAPVTTPGVVTAGPAVPATPTVPVAGAAVVQAAPVAAAVATAPKFRIVLQVGQGEPTFEVRHGDELVMKVLCEKVDVKSGENGGGLSSVTASGNVRFAGYWAGGSCQQLQFMAGTGELMMTGKVTIQVKDKLGRTESELTTESIKYRVDPGAMPGAIKP